MEYTDKAFQTKKKRVALEMRKLFAFLLLLSFCSSVLAQVHIDWNEKSLLRINDTGEYPRLCMLDENIYLCVYEDKVGHCCLNKYSKDWQLLSKQDVFNTQPVSLDTLHGYIVPANAEIYKLRSGRLLYACNYRPTTDGISPHYIALRYTDDNCATWSPVEYIYGADLKFHNGCWEPKITQLPNGEIQLYFSDENYFRGCEDQEIVVMRSFDDGLSWTRPQRVSYSQHHRDGMPVPVILGDSIYIAIEDNSFGSHQPSLVKSSVLDDRKDPVDSASHRREHLLTDTFDKSVYAGAPYIVKDPSDNLYISFQTNYKRRKAYECADMCVAIRSANSSRFHIDSFPFHTPLDKCALWSSLFVLDDKTIVALTSSNVNGKMAPYLIIGNIEHQ